MATFIITIKTRYIGDSKTINAASLTAAKAQATMAFNALSSSIGQITIANENGVKLSHKLIENSRGKWEDVIAAKAEPVIEQKAPQQAAQDYKVIYRRYGESKIALATIEANDLDDAKGKAEVLQAANFWQNEISIYGKGKELLARSEMIGGALAWSDHQVTPQEVAHDPTKDGFLSRCVEVKPEQKKQAFVIHFTHQNWAAGSVTIEEVDTDQAMLAAELLQINNGWREYMTLRNEDLELLAVREEDENGEYCWHMRSGQQQIEINDLRVAALRKYWEGKEARAAAEEAARITQIAKLKKFVVTFATHCDGFARCTIEAKDLSDAKRLACEERAAHYSHETSIIIRDHETGRELSRMHVDPDGFSVWFNYDLPKMVGPRGVFRVVGEIPEPGNSVLQFAGKSVRDESILMGDNGREVFVKGWVAARVLEDESGKMFVALPCDTIKDDSFLVTTAAANLLKAHYAKICATECRIGFIRTKNGHAIIVAEAEAEYLHLEFFPLQTICNY